ncbi:MAG: DUF1638 domain-containing protein [Dehalococcoidia bacterium]|nr:DUF1638 domain-containing protein [Dehalococcoidia bacterium]
MANLSSFREYAIVACGTLSLELNLLRDSGFLDAAKVLYTKPGRHERPAELESQLVKQISAARRYARRIIVVYGGEFCYINVDNPYRTIDTIIKEQEDSETSISRIKASDCIDMLASVKQREEISQGEDVYWLTPGWLKYRRYIYQDWDTGKANENFPQHSGGAIMLDAVEYYDKLIEKDPDKILAFSDWMGISLDAHKVSLDRLKNLLINEKSRYDLPGG